MIPAGETNTIQNSLPPELRDAIAGVADLGLLSEVTLRIIEVTEDPNSTTAQLYQIAKNDPALAATLLKLVNSSLYALPTPILDLDRALVMLGRMMIRNLAIALSLSAMVSPNASSPFKRQSRVSPRDIWMHHIAVGTCARLLARTGSTDVEDAFISGLLHDVGLLVELQLFPHELARVVDLCLERESDFRATEREILGADHEAIGGALAATWKFPERLRSVIAHHHHPEVTAPQNRTLVTTVHVADAVCCQREFGFWMTNGRHGPSDEALEAIGMDARLVAQQLADLPQLIDDTASILGA